MLCLMHFVIWIKVYAVKAVEETRTDRTYAEPITVSNRGECTKPGPRAGTGSSFLQACCQVDFRHSSNVRI